MARIKRAVNAHKKRRKILKLAKGYFGSKSKQYRTASEQVRRSLRYAYIGLISGLKKQGVEVNRKMLADMAVNDAAAFAQLAEVAKK